MRDSGFRVNDRLVLSCPPAAARVAGMDRWYVFLDWPWREADPQPQVRWNGQVALPLDPESVEWLNTPWRLDREPGRLSVGDQCMVGIPPTLVLVRAVLNYSPAKDLGWLPRPTLGLSVVPVGEHQEDEDAGYLVYADGAEPISFERPGGN